MAVINGTEGTDNSFATFADPPFRGTANADTLQGRGGNDLLFAGAGDDLADGGPGDDIVVTGVAPASGPVGLATIDFLTNDGVDIQNGGEGTDELLITYAPPLGGAVTPIVIDLASGDATGGNLQGDRVLNFEKITVLSTLAQGRAILRGSPFVAETLNGGPGDDILEGRGGADRLVGGGGFDTVSYESAGLGVTVDLGLGGTVPQPQPGNPSFPNGNEVGDVIIDVEAIVGSTFTDVLKGRNAATRFDGGGGDDFLEGRAAADTYVVSVGNDRILDAGGADRIETSLALGRSTRVGDDLELIFGTVVAQGFVKNARKVTIEDHFLEGRAVETLLNPTTGQSLVLATGTTGGPGSGIIGGTAADETVDGAGGDDMVFGNDGADIVIGGEGDDFLSGGKGPDIFLIRPGDGNDLIKDFTVRGKNADRLDLTAFGFESADDVLANLAKVDGKTVLTLAEDQTITFERLGGKLGLANLILEAEA